MTGTARGCLTNYLLRNGFQCDLTTTQISAEYEKLACPSLADGLLPFFHLTASSSLK